MFFRFIFSSFSASSPARFLFHRCKPLISKNRFRPFRRRSIRPDRVPCCSRKESCRRSRSSTRPGSRSPGLSGRLARRLGLRRSIPPWRNIQLHPWGNRCMGLGTRCSRSPASNNRLSMSNKALPHCSFLAGWASSTAFPSFRTCRDLLPVRSRNSQWCSSGQQGNRRCSPRRIPGTCRWRDCIRASSSGRCFPGSTRLR